MNSPRFDASVQLMDTYDKLEEQYGNNIPKKAVESITSDLETLMFSNSVTIKAGCASGNNLELCNSVDKRKAMELTIHAYLKGELTSEEQALIEANIGLYMKCLARLSVEGAKGFGLDSDADVMKDLDKQLQQWGSNWGQLAKATDADKNGFWKSLDEMGIPLVGVDSQDGYIEGLGDALPQLAENAKFLADLASNKDGLRDEVLELIRNDKTGVLKEMAKGLVSMNALRAAQVGEKEEARFWGAYDTGVMAGELLAGGAFAKAVKAAKAAKAAEKLSDVGGFGKTSQVIDKKTGEVLGEVRYNVVNGQKVETFVPRPPNKAKEVLSHIQQKGSPPSNYKGGGKFLNKEGLLPRVDINGKPITYKEYDVNPNQKGVDRGAERIVIGSDGKAYYTSDHYKIFSLME